MPYLRPLQQLRQRFEDLANELEVCKSPDQRKEILKQMKDVIDETDKLINREVLHSD